MSHQFFNQINYSASNEDERSELKAFNELCQPRIFCVSASGSRPLSLLLTDPKSITAVDLNPTQNYLLELKVAAIRCLNYVEFLEFLGVREGKPDDRTECYRTSLRNLITPSARKFWDAHGPLIASGLIYSGTWEQNQKAMARPLKILGFPVEAVLNAATLEEQREIVIRKWEGPLWRSLIRISSWRWIWKHVVQEPGIQFVPRDFDIDHYMHLRLSHALHQVHLRESAFFWLLWTGRYQKALPLHLAPESYELIKARVDRIKIVTNSIENYLETTNEKFDAFSLSDFSSYSTRPQSDLIWNHVEKSSSPGAKILARHFLVNHPIPDSLTPLLVQNHQTEETLTGTDNSCIYSFTCASHA